MEDNEFKDAREYGLDDKSKAIIQRERPFFESKIDHILDQFYAYILKTSGLGVILDDEEIRKRARHAQRKHWIENVFGAEFDEAYFTSIKKIGYVHWKYHVNSSDFTSTYHKVLGYFTQAIFEEYKDNPDHMFEVMMAVQKVVFLDLENINNSYRKFLQKSHRELTHTDSLTGVGNRRALMADMEEEIKLFHEGRIPVCIALIDLDYFKQINDTYGHLVGDRILQNLMVYLRETLRNSDNLYRFGGDEFAVIMRNTDYEDGLVTMRRALSEISTREIISNEHSLSVTFSAGLVEYSSDITSIEDLIGKADAALYHAKRRGRNQVSGYKDLDNSVTDVA